MKNIKIGMKKRIAVITLSAIMAIAMVVPAYASTITFKFTRSGNVYGITTSASGYSGYVTAWAKVTTTNMGKYAYKSSKRSKGAASATATRTISNANYVDRAGERNGQDRKIGNGVIYPEEYSCFSDIGTGVYAFLYCSKYYPNQLFICKGRAKINGRKLWGQELL